jgi:hypothetical protein
VGAGGAAGSSSARTTSLLPSRFDETKLMRLLLPLPLLLPPLGMPAASMNLEVADAMLVLAIATASSGQL